MCVQSAQPVGGFETLSFISQGNSLPHSFLFPKFKIRVNQKVRFSKKRGSQMLVFALLQRERPPPPAKPPPDEEEEDRIDKKYFPLTASEVEG